MAKDQAKSPRQIAMGVLNRFNLRNGNNIRELLEKDIQKTSKPAQATDICFGVIKNCLIIDKIISQLSEVPKERISRKVLNILRIAVYELIFTSIDAEYAIVNEAVKLTRFVSGERSVGFVNAVLRKTCRSIADRNAVLKNSDIKKTVPKTALLGCELTFDILPDPKVEQAGFLSTAFSLPAWLIQQWLNDFGYEKTSLICFASNRRSSIYLRPNTLKISAEELLKKLKAENINCELITSADMIILKSPGRISALPGFREGLFSVQDITASTTVRTLAPEKGQTILDLCSAPGGKTTQIAEITNDAATIIATDINNDRLKKVTQNYDRLGINSVKIMNYDKIDSILSKIGNIDAVLLDVPCSNTGVLAKRCEARYRITQKKIEDLTKIQIQLLKKTAPIIKDAGKICYSTCSILKQENSQLIKRFLETKTDFVLEEENLILPSAQKPDRDGGYTAILIKK